MTNILSLPPLPGSWDPFVVATGSDFRSSIQFIADDTADPAIPLAITGIAFAATIRSASDTEDVLFEASTQAGTMTIDGAAGVLSFAVLASVTSSLEAGDALCDIVAIADDMRINLCADNGPLKFTIRVGLA